MWQVYLDEQMNTPSRSDYYRAQVACIVANSVGSKLTLKDFLHPVKFSRKVEQKMTVEQRTQTAKNFFAALVGTGPKTRK